MNSEKTYVCIDLKSFFASVECVERGLDPMTTNLVVADPERSDKTICLAITPPMKAMGIKNRCRVFEIPKTVDYIMASPRMQKYIDYSANIYSIYLDYISKDDIHVYSIDEVFMDVTDYLSLYKKTAKELAVTMMEDVYDKTGITATCGIGTNLYLAKIALDITAKHVPDHIGILDEESYKAKLWNHKPITDFWRVGRGIANRLKHHGILTMKDVAEADEDMLYKEFGVNAELLIDHAWGREPVTIYDIKHCTKKSSSYSSGQVLPRDYSYEETKTILKEMTDNLCLRLVSENMTTELISLAIGYSRYALVEPDNGSIRAGIQTNSSKILTNCILELFDLIVDKDAPIRRINIAFNDLKSSEYKQLNLFTKEEELEKENNIQKAVLDIKNKYGKNAILKGMNLREEGTAIERNRQIGGHKSGEIK